MQEDSHKLNFSHTSSSLNTTHNNNNHDSLTWSLPRIEMQSPVDWSVSNESPNTPSDCRLYLSSASTSISSPGEPTDRQTAQPSQSTSFSRKPAEKQAAQSGRSTSSSHKPAEKQAVLPGRLEHSHITKQLGSGGFGVVYIAREYHVEKDAVVMGRHCVVKHFLRSYNGEEEARYAEIVCTDRPGSSEKIVRMLRAMRYESGLFLKYELCSFGDLGDFTQELRRADVDINELTERRSPPQSFILHVARCLAEALAFLHEGRTYREDGTYFQQPNWRPIIHQDIKPENMLVSDRLPGQDYPNIKLGDIGCAHFLGDEKPYPGTADYQAGDGDHSEQADLWSLGAVIHKLATGVVPVEHPGRRPVKDHSSSNRRQWEAYHNRKRVVQQVNKLPQYDDQLQVVMESFLVLGGPRMSASEAIERELLPAYQEMDEDWEPVFGWIMLQENRLEELDRFKVQAWERCEPTPPLPQPTSPGSWGSNWK
ncbi:kinase-like protein [Pseudovirgaria hyperparasitica]|uniref:Kinase-like protein n=1 Tax=Pseudovirgaria hyperparasitica TaxID=470096 RepID=A0A6A6VZW9_9PEZI|nr:kinase-like protein [Pseudovirgaria hyperparasitica]KAF2756218.1 kinase-like protein [Pseudovirgaria hyperparasitica]